MKIEKINKTKQKDTLKYSFNTVSWILVFIQKMIRQISVGKSAVPEGTEITKEFLKSMRALKYFNFYLVLFGGVGACLPFLLVFLLSCTTVDFVETTRS